MNRSCMVIAIGAVLLGTASLSADGQTAAATGSEDNRVAQFGSKAPPFGFPGWDSRGGSYDRGRRIEEPRDRQPEPARDIRSTRPLDNRQASPPPLHAAVDARTGSGTRVTPTARGRCEAIASSLRGAGRRLGHSGLDGSLAGRQLVEPDTVSLRGPFWRFEPDS